MGRAGECVGRRVIELGIFARTFPRPTLEETLDAIAGHGLSAVQLNLACAGVPSLPDQIELGLSEHIRREMSARGLSMAAVSGTFNMIHPDRQQRRDGLLRLHVLAAAARAMGTSIITLCTGTRDPHDQWRWHPDNRSPAAWRDLLDSLDQALGSAEEHRITLAVEPEPGNVVSDVARARELLDTIGSSALKIVLDPANLVAGESSRDPRRTLDEAFDLLGPEIVLVHAKDRDRDGRVQPAGRGMVDFGHLIRRLDAAGYRGPLIFHDLAEHEVDSAVRYLQQAIVLNLSAGRPDAVL